LMCALTEGVQASHDKICLTKKQNKKCSETHFRASAQSGHCEQPTFSRQINRFYCFLSFPYFTIC
jgi:hypothetical protein